MSSTDIKACKEKLKFLLRGYRHMNSSIKKGLKALGFSVEIGKKHHKIYYGTDHNHPFTISASASDNRSGLNIAHQLSTVWTV